MNAALLELVQRVDPLTALAVLAFWARWEVWKRRHAAEHEALQRLVPHEVTNG